MLRWLALAATAEEGPGPWPEEVAWGVDRLGWAASDREVDRWVAAAGGPGAVFARDLRPAARSRPPPLPGATVYAVQAEVVQIPRAPAPPAWFVDLRQAVVWENPGPGPVDHVVLRFLANGQAAPYDRARIGGVWIDNRPVPFSLEDTVLEVRLPEPLPAGRRVRLLLEASLEVPPFDPRRPLEGDALDPESVGAFGVFRDHVNLGGWLPLVTPRGPDGAFDRRPIRDNTERAMFDPALFSLLLDAPADLGVATTGVTLDRRERDGRATTAVVARGARELAVHLVPDARVVEAEVRGTRIRVWAPAEVPEAGQDLLDVTTRAWALFTDRFGPLDLAEFDVVEAPIRVALGVEYPGLVTVDLVHKRSPYHRNSAQEWTVAHEVAHQWWAASVGNDPGDAPWLDEGLASHAAALYFEHRYGPDAVEMRHELDVREPYRALRDEGRADLPADLEAWRYDLRQYAAIVYGRAAFFFDRVRERVGDEAWFAALRRYHARHAGGFASAEDLLEALRPAAADPAEVDALYQRWIVEAHGYEDLP